MDITWIIDRIGVGGGIWHSDAKMLELKEAGITHIINMQREVEDEELLGREHGIEVLWNPTDDDFMPKEASLFRCGVEFAEEALKDPGAKLFIHCAAGVHRAPMMALAVLVWMKRDLKDGKKLDERLEEARHLIEDKRPVADFADVYVESVERFLDDGLNHRGR
jgi:protein-tyrosine phosphatase